MGDILAGEAIRLVGLHLVTAVREPLNLHAREGMALAATLAGMAFSNCGVAVVHALEYPIGVALHVSHGAGNGLLFSKKHCDSLNPCSWDAPTNEDIFILGSSSIYGVVSPSSPGSRQKIDQ